MQQSAKLLRKTDFNNFGSPIDELVLSAMSNRNKRLAMDECLVCDIEIKADDKQVKCVYCSNSLHIKCAGLSDSRFNKIQKTHCYYCSSQCESSHTNSKKMDEMLASLRILQTSIDNVNKKCDENSLNLKRANEAVKSLCASFTELSSSQTEIKNAVEEVKSMIFSAVCFDSISDKRQGNATGHIERQR